MRIITSCFAAGRLLGRPVCVAGCMAESLVGVQLGSRVAA